jgi:hypothetical protein
MIALQFVRLKDASQIRFLESKLLTEIFFRFIVPSIDGFQKGKQVFVFT